MQSKSLREDVFNLVEKKYNTQPEYLWARYPDYAILRHMDNNKWYAAIMDIPKNKLGIKSNETVDVLNVKCDVVLVGSLLMQEGFFPAYHMQKGKWISILLDGTVSMEQIEFLIDLSFELTSKKRKTPNT